MSRHSMIKRAFLFFGCWALVAGCASECPAGTVREGNRCVREPESSAALDGGASERSDSDTAADKATSIASAAGRSGGNPKAIRNLGGANGGNAGSPGAPSRANRDGGASSEPPSATPGTQRGVMASDAGQSSSNTAADSNSAATGGRGGGGQSGGQAAQPSNGGAPSVPGTPPASDGGSGPPPADSDWTCANVDESCTCVSGVGSNDLCDSKPPCCFTLPSLMSCQCWPEDHENCKNFTKEDPDGKRVETCPPR